MPLDGSAADRLTGESCNRRLRPVTQEYAFDRLPRLILRMKQRSLRYHRISGREGPDAIRIINPARAAEETWVLLRDDFDIVRQIAKDFVVNAFASESQAQVEARIRVYVVSAFAGRGVPA